MESHSKPTSYQDLLKHFKQAQNCIQTPRTQKLVYKPLHLKQSATHRQNKQNQSTSSHTQSVLEKPAIHKSQWIEEDVLKEYNEKRKDRQLQLSYNKFITYITNILASLTGTVPPELLINKITYLQYLAALKEMALIKDNYQPTPTDAVSGLWNQLAQHGQTSGVFILFIGSILNMRKQEDENNKYSYLAKRYSQLRYTRMEMLGKMKTTQEEEQFPFTPCISQRSRTLAASRSKSKNRNTKCFAQQSLLEEYNDSEIQPEPHGTTIIGNRRSQILYKLAKEKSLQKRRDKKSNEVQYQKSIQQLTFHPKIHPNSNKRKNNKAIQGEQDSINRMIRGRVEREVRKIINAKGLPYNEKMFEKMKKQRYEALQRQRKSQNHHNRSRPIQQPQITTLEKQQTLQPEPDDAKKQQNKISEPIVLTIEVDEDRCQKLVIDDPNRYKQAAAKFIKDLNLKAEMYDKLIQGVQKALKFQLTQVDEDSCESEHDSAGQ